MILIYLNMLLRASNGLGMECSNKFLLTADIISLAVDSGVTSGNKPGKLFKIIIFLLAKRLQTPFVVAYKHCVASLGLTEL